MKSFPNGISLHMDADAPWEDITEELATKFSEARAFFKDSKVALSLEGRSLSPEEEKEVIQIINDHSDLQIICLIGKNEATNKGIIKALKRVETEKEEYNGRFHSGSLKSGQTLETEGNVVIFGNVEKGARIVASKNIFIIGSLQGRACAGTDGDNDAFVFALKFEPQHLKIADLNYYTREKSLFSNKNKMIPQIAHIRKGEIVLDTVSKEWLNQYEREHRS